MFRQGFYEKPFKSDHYKRGWDSWGVLSGISSRIALPSEVKRISQVPERVRWYKATCAPALDNGPRQNPPSPGSPALAPEAPLPGVVLPGCRLPAPDSTGAIGSGVGSGVGTEAPPPLPPGASTGAGAGGLTRGVAGACCSGGVRIPGPGWSFGPPPCGALPWGKGSRCQSLPSGGGGTGVSVVGGAGGTGGTGGAGGAGGIGT